MSQDIQMTSNKPYLVGAFYDWISDNDLTPYIVVDVSVAGVQVPMAFVNNGQIVLNISGGAVGSIALAETAIEFTARFGGKLEYLVVPYGAIGAIYAKENGAGTAFAIEHAEETGVEAENAVDTPAKPSLGAVEDSGIKKSEDSNGKPESKKSGKPSLKVVK